MVCLVTGSSRGIGKSIALAFGRKGHRVVVHYREKRKEAEEVASQIGESIVVQADVSKADEVKMLMTEVLDTWGSINMLINNAGVTRESLLIKTSEEDFNDLMGTNLKGPFNCIRAAARNMMKQKQGHIINISSFAGLKGKDGLSAYSASKAGLIGLTKTAALELSRYNIMVNAVLPGYVLTDMGYAAGEKAREMIMKESTIKEFSDSDNVAEFICFLTGTKGITGQVFNLDSRII
jgi:3-oxoacyl-[acyl-carrier protein] reductase